MKKSAKELSAHATCLLSKMVGGAVVSGVSYTDLVEKNLLIEAAARLEHSSESHRAGSAVYQLFDGMMAEQSRDEIRKDLQPVCSYPASAYAEIILQIANDHTDVEKIRDYVFETALQLLLEPIFPGDLGHCDPIPEKAIDWLAKRIEKGLTRAYLIHVEAAFENSERLWEILRSRIADGDLLRLLERIEYGAGRQLENRPLAKVLANCALQEVDPILRQVNVLGQRDQVAHVVCARFDSDIILLMDHDAEFEWLLPALQKRLREALSAINETIDPTRSQLVDLANGKPLRFLGHELRATKNKNGSVQVQFKLLEERQKARAKKKSVVGKLLRPFAVFPAAWRLVRRLRLQHAAAFVRDAWQKASAFQFSWRHVPVTLCPIIAILFGLSSPFTWIIAGLAVACNLQATGRLSLAALQKAPHYWLELAAAACLISAICLAAPLVSEFNKNRSREDPAPKRPPGFFLGQYNPSWDGEPIPYGLYLPPHLLEERGPYPLVVFLHGSGEATKELIFTVGVPQAIEISLGEHLEKGKFDCVGFFPIMERNSKKQISEEDHLENAMMTLDYVVRRHHIDPKRIYLTGLSLGGWRAWRLVEQYPDKWAALGLVSSVPYSLKSVPHIATWIFQGGKDGQPSPEHAKAAAKQFKDAGVEVRYTEVPNKGHEIWWEAYGPRDLYDWFLKHKKE